MASLQKVVKGDPFTLTPRLAWILSAAEARRMFVVCGTQHWRAELPPGWCAQHGPGNVAIYHPDGVGAIQISSFRKPQGTVADADLREMAEGVPHDGNGLRPVQAGEFVGLRCESLDDRAFWARWFVGRGAVAVHITYNCPALECGREREAVGRVVASLTCPLPQRHAEPLSWPPNLRQ